MAIAIPTDPSFIVSTLSFLVAVYQAVKPNNTVVKVLNEVRVEVETGQIENPREFVQQKIESRLDEETAKTVTQDLNLLQAFLIPTEPETFNYYDLLLSVFESGRTFCDRNHIFRLRGLGQKTGKVLELRRTAGSLCPLDVTSNWAGWKYGHEKSAPQTSKVKVFLAQFPFEPKVPYGIDLGHVLPIMGDVTIAYSIYHSMGGASPKTAGALVYFFPGDEQNRLGYRSDETSEALIGTQKMLRSSDVMAILEALRDDIIEYVNDIKDDKALAKSALRAASENLLSAFNPPEA